MADYGDNLRVFGFEGFVFDARERVVYRHGDPVALAPKVLDTLAAFLNHPGETLSKEDLMSMIWPDSFVEESNLIQNVAVLRRALGDDPKEGRFIATVPGRGYRFVAHVVRGRTVDEVSHREAHKTQAAEQMPGAPEHSLIPWVATSLVAVSLAVAAFVYYSFYRDSPEPPRVGYIQQITSSPSLDLHTAFSPDGASIAYASNRTGAFEIYIRQVTGGAAEIQLTTDGGNNLQPSFSPDGLRVAFHSVGRTGIWVVPALGGVPKRLTDFGSNPAWSPDGTKIAFQSDPVNAIGSGTRALPPSTLWVIPVDGTGEARQITSVGSPPGGHGGPKWSPGSDRIVFESSDFASSRLWSVAADGSDLTSVFDETSLAPGGSRLEIASDPVYSSDGRSVFYVGDVGASINLVAVDSKGRAIGPPIKIFDAAVSRVRYLALSPDGKRLVHSSIANTSNIFVSERDARAAWAEPRQLTQSTRPRSVAPAFSPDGSKIAFQTETAASSPHITVMDADGSNVRQITTAPGYGPSWFPTGDRVGFSVPRGGNSEYWFAAADGSTDGKLFDYDDKEVFNGKLSADGKSVLFNSKRSGTINIWRIPIEGGAAEQMTFDQELAGFASMSPDGRWIAFQIKRGNDTHIAYMSSAGGDPVQLTSEPGQSWVSNWGPDSEHMVFAGRRGAIWNIYSVSRTTGQIQQITSFDNINSFVRAPTWSPLGDKIAYERNESFGNLWMIDLH